jgi:hypothetical protein
LATCSRRSPSVVRRRRPSVGDDAALVDDEHAVTGRLHLREDVGREDDRAALAQLTDQGADLGDLVGVEARGGLIEDEQVGLMEDRLGEADALAIALGERAKTSRPSTVARPSVAPSEPVRMRMVVDLPAPLGPRKPTT